MDSGQINIYKSWSAPLFLFRDALLTVIYPQACKICEKNVESRAEGFICRTCWQKTRIFDGNQILCEKCGLFLKDGVSEFETFCRRCDEHFYDRAKAAGFYEKALSASLLNLKKTPFVPQILQDIFIRAFERSGFTDASMIIPVPISKRRLKERGFNQSLILAEILAKASGIKMNADVLKRKGHTAKHRAAMDRKSRFDSVENVFEVKIPQLIRGEKVLLIDDVFTSGATVSNCAKALKESGAKKIYVLTVARVS